MNFLRMNQKTVGVLEERFSNNIRLMTKYVFLLPFLSFTEVTKMLSTT